MTTMDIVRPRLRWFIREMDRRLARPKNQAKEDWRDPETSLYSLFNHASDELGELGDELPVPPNGLTAAQARRVIKEALDLANMAFMVADRVRHEAAKAKRRRQR